MTDILNEIVAWKRREVELQKQETPPNELYALVEGLMTEAEGKPRKSMRESLAQSASGIIAEFKRKSPSRGWIHPDIGPADVVPSYVSHGASAVSILTDEHFFGGKLGFLREMSYLPVPLLRKDFIIDEYQLFQARWAGASAVLLIAAELKLDECRELARRAHDLGLEVLLEIHSEWELDYAALDADMLGVNNRNLGTFHTDVQNSFRLAEALPKEKLWVSESGIGKAETLLQLREAGYRGFLIGETFMKETDPGLALKRFISITQNL